MCLNLSFFKFLMQTITQRVGLEYTVEQLINSLLHIYKPLYIYKHIK